MNLTGMVMSLVALIEASKGAVKSLESNLNTDVLTSGVRKELSNVEESYSKVAREIARIEALSLPPEAKRNLRQAPDSQKKSTVLRTIPDGGSIQEVPFNYPAVNGGVGPKFKLGDHSAILFKDVDQAVICFGDPNGQWMKVRFYSNPKRIVSPALRDKYGIPDHIATAFLAITIETSESVGQEKWWNSENFFLSDSNQKGNKPSYLALNMYYLAKGHPDLGGKTYPTDSYTLVAPNMLDAEGHSFTPSLLTEVGYTNTNGPFPWSKVSQWQGFFDAGPDTNMGVSTEFVQSLSDNVSFGVVGKGSVEFYRSTAEKNLYVPVATSSPSTASKKPTPGPTTPYPTPASKKPTPGPTTLYPTAQQATRFPTPSHGSREPTIQPTTLNPTNKRRG